MFFQCIGHKIFNKRRKIATSSFHLLYSYYFDIAKSIRKFNWIIRWFFFCPRRFPPLKKCKKKERKKTYVCFQDYPTTHLLLHISNVCEIEQRFNKYYLSVCVCIALFVDKWNLKGIQFKLNAYTLRDTYKKHFII